MVYVAKVLEEFPFLLPSHDFKVWNGIIDVENEEVCVKIAVPNFPSLDNISLMCPVNWEEKLHHKIQTYLSLPNRKCNIMQLLQFLKYNQGPSNGNIKVAEDISDSVAMLHIYTSVLEELRKIGPDSVVGCSADLSRVTLHKIDGRGVDHKIVVGLPMNYPNSPASLVDADLPQAALSELTLATTILEIMDSFENIIESLQDFWLVYEDLKINTWIIDPEHPQLRDTYCRIVIGENLAMLLTLNPQDVRSCPDIKFLGPENLVNPFINSVENNLKTLGWDEDSGVCENLLRLLGLNHFPLQDSETGIDTIKGECSICFSVRVHEDSPLPAKVCNNTRCDSYFHLSCLAQWFQAVPTNETSFNLISGGCPSCGEKILCPVKVN